MEMTATCTTPDGLTLEAKPAPTPGRCYGCHLFETPHPYEDCWAAAPEGYPSIDVAEAYCITRGIIWVERGSTTLPALIDGHTYHRQDSRYTYDRGVYRYVAATNTLMNLDSYWRGGSWSGGDGFGTYREDDENFEVWTDITDGGSE